jgi:hypothetical protein
MKILVVMLVVFLTSSLSLWIKYLQNTHLLRLIIITPKCDQLELQA